MNGESIGMVEVSGLSTAMVAANAASQTADVEVRGMGYMHEGRVTVTITGSVASVRAAVDAVADAVGPGAMVASSVIPRPDPQVEPVVAERFVRVGDRVGAPRVPGRGRRFSPPVAGGEGEAAPAKKTAAKKAGESTRRRGDAGADGTAKG